MQAISTLADFIERHGVTMDAEWADRNPNAADDWARDATHWTCTLRVEDRTMVVPFSQGSAHTSEPTAAAVLNCLASDAASVANAPDWLDWAEEMGYAGEGAAAMRRARETHATIERQAGELRELVGDDAYETLLWNTERL